MEKTIEELQNELFERCKKEGHACMLVIAKDDDVKWAMGGNMYVLVNAVLEMMSDSDDARDLIQACERC